MNIDLRIAIRKLSFTFLPIYRVYGVVIIAQADKSVNPANARTKRDEFVDFAAYPTISTMSKTKSNRQIKKKKKKLILSIFDFICYSARIR